MMVEIKLATVAVMFFLGISNIFGQNLEQARNYALADRFDDAKEQLNKIIQSEPNNPSTYFYLGQTIIREYLSDSLSNSIADVCAEAKKAFETGLQKDSTFALNFVGKGMLEQLCNNDTTAANKYFQRAIASFPKNKKKYTEIQGIIYSKIAYASTMGKTKRNANAAVYYLGLAKEIAPQSFEVAMQAGEIFLDRKDGSNAIQNFSRAESINASSPLPLIKKGDLMLAAKNYNQARTYYDQAKEIDSTNATVYKSYGELWNTAGRYDLAKENFRKYLSLSGNNIPAKVSYVNSLYKTKDYDEAIVVVQEIQAVDNTRNYLNRVAGYSSFDKKNPDYELANKFMAAFFNNAKPISITARDYLYYGRALIRLKKDSVSIAKGVEMMNKSYEISQDDALITEIALAYVYIDDYQNAIATFNKKIAAGTATPYDLLQLGKSYNQIKDYVKAGETFDKIVAADPKNMDALVRSANASAFQDPESKLGLAKPKYDAVIALGNTDPKKYLRELFDAYKYMGSYYLYVDKQNKSQSEDYYKKILALDPNNKEWLKVAYGGLASLYTGQENWEPAKNMFIELSKLEPNNASHKKAISDIQKQINVKKVMGN
jgi:tetratricopeptide (TPR) repeat protein